MDVVTEKGLPKWFNLSWYDQLNDFSPNDWAHTLQIRYYLNNALNNSDKLQTLKNIFQNKISEPCANMEPLLQSTPYFDYPQNVLDTPTVGLLSTENFMQIHRLMGEYGYEEQKPFQWQNFEDEDIPNTQYVNDVLNEELSSAIQLELRLDGSDKEILSNLKDMLPKIRERYSISNQKHFTTAKLGKWCNSQSLAYIDLKLGGRLNGTHLKDHTLGITLFPDEYDINPSDRVRRTTKDHADEMLQLRTITALFTQSPN